MLALLAKVSWPAWRHHPWRHASAALAVMLGVALAFSVHLINESALAEFSSAVQAVNGQPDAELRARLGTFSDTVLDQVAAHPQVEVASPVLEANVALRRGHEPGVPAAPAAPAPRVQLLGLDALQAARLSPALLGQPDARTPSPPSGQSTQTTQSGQRPGLDLFAPDAVFLNPAARELLGHDRTRPLTTVDVQVGLQWHTLRVAGSVAAGGGPLLVMDVAAAQELVGQVGQLSRLDVRLTPGALLSKVLASLNLPAQLVAQRPQQAGERFSNLSRAYRVNLTVLALVALFTGGFLVFSVLSLSVTQRQKQLALLGVLGLSGRERLHLVLAESVVLGLVGSAAGLALGTALAAGALRWLGGDLGGGAFAGLTPPLQWSTTAALVYGGLGVVAAAVGGWWPAQAAQRLAPALALKGLGQPRAASRWVAWAGPLMLLAAGLLCLLPPVAGVPLAAYLAVGLALVGGIVSLPVATAWALDALSPLAARHALAQLPLERARRVREAAATITSGVVASLALSVALTVMVGSFRQSVMNWLDVVLPAPLYLRTTHSASSALGGSAPALPPDVARQIAALPGVARVDGQRVLPLLLDTSRPPITLLARPMVNPAQALPLVGGLVEAPASAPTGSSVPVYISETMAGLYGLKAGDLLPEFSESFKALPLDDIDKDAVFFVSAVWRDYARQNGSAVLAMADYQRLTGDLGLNDLSIHLQPGVPEDSVLAELRTWAQSSGAEGAVEWASSGSIRQRSLTIFDRSFAVTTWLQAVAIGIGLFGVAASFSAQVLARQREFGLLAHLGLDQRQILQLVALEGLTWTVLGSVAGLLLGLAVSVILVHVVNPQSFHWTMELSIPTARLLALCAAVVASGTLTAWAAGRAAAGKDAVLAVKEDW